MEVICENIMAYPFVKLTISIFSKKKKKQCEVLYQVTHQHLEFGKYISFCWVEGGEGVPPTQLHRVLLIAFPWTFPSFFKKRLMKYSPRQVNF